MTTLSLPERACPLCESTEKRTLFKQRFDALSEGTLLRGYDVTCCDSCGFVYADRIPEQSKFDEHYARMSKYEYSHTGGEVSELDAQRFRAIAELIERTLPDHKLRILDVGCSTGGLLSELKARGYHSVKGLDPSAVCSRLAREFYGIEVKEGTIFENDVEPESVDVIILVGVLEHIRDVMPALKGIEKCLSKNGVIYAEVPDLTRAVDWPGAPYQEFSTEHVGFFGPKSLAHLFSRAGYKTMAMERVPRQFTKSTVMPSACGFFERATGGVECPIDDETEPSLLRYIERSADAERATAGMISDLAEEGRDVVVWGTGTHTLHLLKTTRLSEVQISAFVDVNANYHGKELIGRPIIAPEAMRSRSEPILVSSYAFQEEIIRFIRSELAIKNQVIQLY